MKGSGKVDISSVISGRDAPEMFELVEAALDAISEPMGFDVMADDGNPGALGGGNGLCAQIGDEAAKSIAVVTPAGNDAASGLSFEQGISLGEIVGLTGREDEPQRPAERIGQQMNFGCQSSSGAPQSLIFGPLFPLQPAGGRAPGWYRASSIRCAGPWSAPQTRAPK